MSVAFYGSDLTSFSRPAYTISTRSPSTTTKLSTTTTKHAAPPPTKVFHDLPTPPDSTRSSLEKRPSSNAEKILEFSTGSRTESLLLTVSPEEYDAVVHSLEELPGTVRYEYNWATGLLTVYGNPSTAHEALILPLGHVFSDQLMHYVRQNVGSAKLMSMGQATRSLCTGDKCTLEKGPDASIKIRLDADNFSLIVAEIGVSQTHKELYRVARHYLYESNCEIVLVVLVKFTKPQNPEIADNWKATMEFLSR
jgi:hypothetical protein